MWKMSFETHIKKRIFSSYARSEIIAFLSTAAAFIYHILVFIAFGVLKIYPMFFFNFFSISLFAVLLYLIPRKKAYEFMYLVAAVEVIIHQILAEYCLGSYTCFRSFIFLMGALPYLVFQENFRTSAFFTIFTTVIFFVLSFLNMKSRFILHPNILLTFRLTNIFLSFSMVIMVIMIYSFIAQSLEKQLEIHGENLEKEIRLAAFIQQNFYRHDAVKFDGWDIAYYNRPLAGVSGDLYDFYTTKDGTEGAGLFDVSGHGISSGLVTMLVKNIIQQEFENQKDLDLWEIVNIINDRVIAEKGKIQNYLTGILIRFIKEDSDSEISYTTTMPQNTANLELVNAGHPYPLIYRRHLRNCEYLERASDTNGGSIGIAGFPAYYYSQFVTLNQGDEIILYTDGISDAENPYGERFGQSELIKVINDCANLPAREQIKHINHRIHDFCSGEEIKDDMTMIIIRKA